MTNDIGAVERRVERFNEGWVFVPDAVIGDADLTATSGEPVTLPHTWNALDGQDGGNDYRRGASTYIKRFAMDAGDDGGVVGVPRRELVGRRVPERDTSRPSRRRLLDVPVRADACTRTDGRATTDRCVVDNAPELDDLPAASGFHVLRRDLSRRHPDHRAAVALRARRPRRARPRRDPSARRLARDGCVRGSGHRRRLGALHDRWRRNAEHDRRRRDGARARS